VKQARMIDHELAKVLTLMPYQGYRLENSESLQYRVCSFYQDHRFVGRLGSKTFIVQYMNSTYREAWLGCHLSYIQLLSFDAPFLQTVKDDHPDLLV